VEPEFFSNCLSSSLWSHPRSHSEHSIRVVWYVPCDVLAIPSKDPCRPMILPLYKRGTEAPGLRRSVPWKLPQPMGRLVQLSSFGTYYPMVFWSKRWNNADISLHEARTPCSALDLLTSALQRGSRYTASKKFTIFYTWSHMLSLERSQLYIRSKSFRRESIMRSLSALIIGARLLACANSQFPPTPEGVTVIKSKFHSDITISYKEVYLSHTSDLRYANKFIA